MIFELADTSERPGYLPYDGRLAGLANARSASFFNLNVVGLLQAGFKTVQIDGREWIYNERLLVILDEQRKKLWKDDLVISSTLLTKANFIDIEGLELETKKLFEHYLLLFHRDKRYRLTQPRQKKAEMRLLEYMADEKATLLESVAAAKEAMGNLAASEFHTEGGYFDWTDHIFGSKDIFQKRLDMKGRVTKIDKKQNEAGVGAKPFEVREYCWNITCQKPFIRPGSLFCSEECAAADKLRLAHAKRV